jgi:3-oxoacyl-[acyl-carrier-protein] synthase I
MTEPLFVTCLALVCPVGLTPESAVAAMRAGIDAFGELPYRDNSGDPIRGAAVPTLAGALRGRRRITELLVSALEDVRERLPEHSLDTMPLLLCTRERDRPGPNVGGIVAEAEARLGISFRRAGSAHLPFGPVSVFRALEQARQLCGERDSTGCLIVAVDTLVDAQALDWLDRSKRLKREGHSDGVIPGEAACVALVSRQAPASSGSCVLGLGFGQETATVLNEEPFLGRGMATAIQGALAEARVEMHQVNFRISDVAGESYAFEELALAQIRTLRKSRECQVLLHPAGSIGDCGAATGLVQLAWAEQSFARGYACGPLALAHTSAASGARAVAVTSAEPL